MSGTTGDIVLSILDCYNCGKHPICLWDGHDWLCETCARAEEASYHELCETMEPKQAGARVITERRDPFTTLTRDELLRLMDYLHDAANETFAVAETHSRIMCATELYADEPWHHLHQDLCNLHTDVFEHLLPEYTL